MDSDKPKNIEVTTWLSDMFTDEEIRLGDIQAQIAVSIQLKRKELGLSQKQLANKLGISIDTMSDWENGDFDFTSESKKPNGILHRLASDFGIDF